MYDLHLHSHYSDGRFSPKTIAEIASQKGLKGLALSDHDTMDGIDEMIYFGKKYDLDIIPSIEFGTTYRKTLDIATEIHILGYFIDKENKKLNEIIQFLKDKRIERVKKTLYRLKDIGFKFSIDEIYSKDIKGIVDRVHVARLLLDNNIVKSIDEAFDKYLDIGRPAYIEKTDIDYTSIINLIHHAGGKAICAHPKTIGDDEIVLDLIKAGIDGIEIINTKHNFCDTKKYLNLAIKNNLIPTGGSDCHGGENYLIGKYLCNKKIINMLSGKDYNEK